MRICVIGPSRFPISEPFAGGLEAHTHSLVTELRRRGHAVTLFAAPGSDPALDVHLLDVAEFTMSSTARNDVGAMPVEWMGEHHAYLALMIDLAEHGAERYDVVLNVSIHHLPVAMARLLPIPLVTTLHTPPIGWIESAARIGGATVHFVAVSSSMREAWAPTLQSSVILNGVDTRRWLPGPGGGPALWSGRLVPEKGPDLAIAAAQLAGIPLDIAGPAFDREFFEAQVEPHLGDRIRYLGHLDHAELRERLRNASVALVTPRWDEPYGLVAAEALAAGTPVAAFARGALPEILDDRSGRLAAPGDVADLARAMAEAARLSRADARHRAETFCSLGRMVAEYESLLAEVVSARAPAPVPSPEAVSA